MSRSFSSFEAQQIISAAQAALKTIDAIIEEQERYAKEIAELYGQLLDQSGNALAKSIKLVRVGPGKYRTLAGGKRGGTKSNLYLAAKSGEGATVQTRSGTYDAQECYKRALDLACIDECDDAFEDLVFVGYKKWLHGEIIEKPLPEWKAMRLVVAEAIEAAEPALQGGLARLFMSSTTKQAAFDALDKLQKMDVAHIVSHMDYWPTFSAERFSSKEALVYCFRHDEEDRGNILGCLQKEIGDFKMGSDDSRPFSSEEAQQALDRFQGIADVPASIAAAQGDVKNGIPSAIDEMRESDVLAQLALTPIDELGKQKTGAQVKRLQDAGITTLADLYERLSSPEKGDLPGVGPKTRCAIEAYLDPIVADIQKRWRLELAANDKSDAAMRLLRTVQAYLELGGLYEKAQSALASLEPLSDTQIEALRCAADPIDWLLADDERVHAAGCAMEAANKQLESEDGTWLASMLDGSEVRRLMSNLAHIGEARKAFRAHPDAFMKVIGDVAPEVLAPAESAVADAAPEEAAAPAKQQKRKTAAKKKSQQPTSAKTDTDLLEQTEAFYKKFEGLTMMFPPAEDAPVFNAKSKYSVRVDAPRAQGSTFSLAIPDGWVSEKDTSGRAFVLVPEEHAGEGVDSNIAILYGDAPVPDDYASNMQKIGVDPALWSLNYEARSCRSDFTLEMHEVQARNCRCAVVQVPTADEECSEFYIYPYSLIGQDYARVTFYDPGDVTYEQARTFVDNLARTVEASGSTVPTCLDQLEERFLARSNDFSFAYREVFMPVMDQLANLRNSVLGAGARFCEALNPAAGSRARNISGIIALSQFFDACVPIAVRLIDVIEEWARVDRSQEILNRFTCKSMLEEIGDKFIISSDMFYDSALSAEELEKLCVPSPRQRGLLERISHALVLLGFDEYGTEKKNETVIEVDVSGIIRDAINHFASQSDSELQSHVVTEDDDQAEELEGRLEPAEQQSSMSARARKNLAGQITPDQYDSPTVICNLLAQRTFFFDSEDIAWDGRHHTITNVNVNASQAENLSDDALNTLMNETGNTFGVVLTEIEKDELLFVPRSRIASGIEQALPEGDLTGITLCYLIGCLGAFSWRGTENCYQVYFDPRLEKGIPQFFSLVARLIWDIRDQFLMSEDSFDIMFFRTRNFDADAFLGDVDEPVIGAQDCPNLLNVREQPSVDLSDQSAKTNC